MNHSDFLNKNKWIQLDELNDFAVINYIFRFKPPMNSKYHSGFLNESNIFIAWLATKYFHAGVVLLIESLLNAEIQIALDHSWRS